VNGPIDTPEAQAERRLTLLTERTPVRTPGPAPEHGARSRYTHHACRCRACRDAEARYQKARALRLEQARRAS
jgi:hypothetical protein